MTSSSVFKVRQILNYLIIRAARSYTVSMLQLSASLLNKSVLSLRTGSPIATITGPVINPDNLKIQGFYCQDSFSKRTLVLLYQDIREIAAKGYIVNDHEVLVDPDELVRLK